MGTNKKIEQEFLKICRYTFFKYLKKGIRKKNALGFLKICKYTFLIFGKVDKQKNAARSL